MKDRKLILICLVLSLIVIITSCTSVKNIPSKNKDTIEEDNQVEGENRVDTNNDINKEDNEVTEIQVFADRYFQKGINVKSQTDGVAIPIGKITFEDSEEEPQWSLAQWYCGYFHKDDKDLYDTYNILNGERKSDGSKHTFLDASKKISLDTETGQIYMRLEASKEYTAPRKEGEPWPHILFEYNTSERFHLKDLKSLRIDMEFMITKMKEAFDNPLQIDKNLHTAQFVFYIIVSNTNVNSKDFGNYIWFGLNLYDARWEIVPAYASQDGGKEINTGAFIYQPISSTFCKVPTRVGETQKIDYDLMPRIKDALEAAQQAGYLVNTKWEDLSLGGGNFGVEVTGTYDIAIDIAKLNLWAGK